MSCEICGKEETPIWVILPIKQANGKLDTISCLDCAKKSKVYCLEHDRPYLAFTDREPECPLCILDEAMINN